MSSKPSKSEGPKPRSSRPLSVEYNLEKEPLRTGRSDPAISLEPGAKTPTGRTSRPVWSRNWMTIILVVLFIIIGLFGVYYVFRFVDRYFDAAGDTVVPGMF